MTIFEVIDEIKEKIDYRNWVLTELKRFEAKYGLITVDFIEKWQTNKIIEPEDHITLEEFLEWDGLAESLTKVENELKELEDRIRAS